MLLEKDIAQRKHERVTWMDHACECQAWLIERADRVLCEANSFVTLHNRGEIASIATCYESVSLPQSARHMSNFPPTRFTRIDGTANRFKSLHEERANEV